jgi:hypothetical protein
MRRLESPKLVFSRDIGVPVALRDVDRVSKERTSSASRAPEDLEAMLRGPWLCAEGGLCTLGPRNVRRGSRLVPAKAVCSESAELPLAVSVDREERGGEEGLKAPGGNEGCVDMPREIPSAPGSTAPDWLACDL